MRKFSKKTVAVALATAVVVSGGGVAFAYWTATGSGSGSAGTGAGTEITVNQTSSVSGLRPGANPQSLRGDFSNSSGGSVYVGSVTISISSVTTVDDAQCAPGDYTLAGTATVDQEVGVGAHTGAWSGLTIAFNDKPTTNQDGCKGATVNLAYTVSGAV